MEWLLVDGGAAGVVQSLLFVFFVLGEVGCLSQEVVSR